MAYPFRKILCAVDFDENSLAALEIGGQIARQNEGSVLLFHCIPEAIPAAGMPPHVDITKDTEEAAKKRLRRIADNLLQGTEYELLTNVGEPARAIIRSAKRAAADVIVMGTHARRGIARVILGSIAGKVLRGAPCPVLCIRDRERDSIRRVRAKGPA